MNDYRKLRFFEMIPGILVWITLILAVVGSIFAPLITIYFIILFDLFWLMRIIYLVIHLLISWKRFKLDSKINWLEKLYEVKDKDYRDYYHLIF
ncbi:hypothetical protein HOG50_03595 [bacterium]|nr:hypothetical protein [bacterium]